MWTCLYLSHIVVIIMIIIAILGIIYEIVKKKIKVYHVIVVFLFCVISMSLVAGITSMQYINNVNDKTSVINNNLETDYWTYDPDEMAKIENYALGYTKLVDLKTGNLLAVRDEFLPTGREEIDLSNKEEADKECQEINIQEELNITDEYLITLDSKEFVKATDDIYYITYNYTYKESEEVTESGKIYYIVNSNNSNKTFIMTSINNEEKKAEFEERVLEVICTMNF